MLMRKLGRTGLRVSALCLGGNTFGWTTDQKASEAVLDAYDVPSPVVDRTFPLDEAAAAHGYLETGAGFGKVVLETA